MVLIALGFLLIPAVTTLLPKLVHLAGGSSLKSLKLILFRALFIDHNRLPRIHLRLVFLFFNLFLFFNRNFLFCTIKTDKVTVDTHEMVDSAAQLISVSQTLATGSEELDFIKTAPKGSFLSKLAGKNFFKLTNLEELERMQAYGIDRYVVFGGEVDVYRVTDLLASHAQKIGAIAFIKSAIYYEFLTGFLMRKSLDKKRKELINSG